ncbi:MAG: hypothetical protein QOF74_9291, partial [Caballeronia mineralivorans]|nr:hypothetical protein [Caballeronia mineralivorans]
SPTKYWQLYESPFNFNRGTGAAQADFPGRNNQTGVAVGLRNIF